MSLVDHIKHKITQTKQILIKSEARLKTVRVEEKNLKQTLESAERDLKEFESQLQEAENPPPLSKDPLARDALAEENLEKEEA